MADRASKGTTSVGSLRGKVLGGDCDLRGGRDQRVDWRAQQTTDLDGRITQNTQHGQLHLDNGGSLQVLEK